MANKKIRLTYFWADENVMLDDLQRNVSAEMTAWGSKFYANNGFDLDVDPPESDKTSVKRVSKFALVKSKGISPDFRNDEDIEADKNARLAKLEKQLAAVEKEAEASRQRLTQLHTRWDDAIAAARSYLQGPSPTVAGTDQRFNAIESAQKDYETENVTRVSKLQESGRLYKAIQAVREEDKTPLGYEALFRWQIASRVRASKINVDKRLCVVFCRPAGQAWSEGELLGETFEKLQNLLVSPIDRTLLWPFAFIVVNIKGKARGVVAHELVHAAGHNHPDTFLALDKKLASMKPVSMMKVPQEVTTLGEETNPVSIGGVPQSILSPGPDPFYSSELVKIPGAYFDGADNDIMNYMHPEDPLKCILSAADKELLDKDKTFIGP